MDYPPRKTTPALARAARIKLRKSARTKLYAMLYGACAKGAMHSNMPWIDGTRLGSHLPEKAEYELLVKASAFNPVQLARVRARFAQLGGDLSVYQVCRLDAAIKEVAR